MSVLLPVRVRTQTGPPGAQENPHRTSNQEAVQAGHPSSCAFVNAHGSNSLVQRQLDDRGLADIQAVHKVLRKYLKQDFGFCPTSGTWKFRL